MPWRRMQRSLKRNSRNLVFLGLLVYFLIPLIFYFSSSLQRYLIFKHYSYLPSSQNLSLPESENLFGTYNRYIPSSSEGIIALWQILPDELILKDIKQKDLITRGNWFIEQLTDNRAVVLYCHGNGASRAQPHRILLYKVLQKLGYHVISFDYRGYADSTSIVPSEESVISDVLDVIRWIRFYSSAPLYVWGHSLGTGVSLSAIAALCERESCIDALVLQSPFSSLADEVRSHPLSFLYHYWPFFDWLFISPLHNQGIVFDNKANIVKVKCPILILHAEDDLVVPFNLGKKLFVIGRTSRDNNTRLPHVKFVPFSPEYGYGHNFIVMAPELSVIIKKFFDEASSDV